MSDQITGTLYLRDANDSQLHEDLKLEENEKIIMVIGTLKVPIDFDHSEMLIPVSGSISLSKEVFFKMHTSMRVDYSQKISPRGYYYSGLKMGSLLLEPIWKV